MTRALVTGGAGFIGSHLVRALLQKGDQVRVLDNFSTGKVANLSGLENSIDLLEGDIRDASTLAAAVAGIDLVFHQAAMVSVPQSMADPQRCFDINVQGSLNLYLEARKAGVARIVQASSAAVYGEPEILPLDEAQTTNPLSPYAASKLVNEIYGRLYTQVFGLPVVSLRYFNVFGPNQPPDSDYAAAVPIFTRKLLDRQQPTIFGDGHQVRDFIYVRDVARANIQAAECEPAAGEVFNICTGQEVDLIQLLATLGQVTGCDPEPDFQAPRPGDVYRSIGNPVLARRIMQFQAEVSLRDGLAETVRWMSA